jgi:hypothetical protein
LTPWATATIRDLDGGFSNPLRCTSSQLPNAVACADQQALSDFETTPKEPSPLATIIPSFRDPQPGKTEVLDQAVAANSQWPKLELKVKGGGSRRELH